MRKSIFKKMTVLALSAACLLTTACNSEIKVKYDYNVDDYVELGQYENIKITVDKSSIEAKRIEAKIKSDTADNTTYTEVTRGAVAEDQLLVTYSATIGGSAADGLTNTDGTTVVLGTDSLPVNLDELDDALYGMKAGETKVVVLTVPEEYGNDYYAGAKVVFEVTVQTVAQPNVPMITDAYVQEAFGLNTVEEYKAHVKEEVQSNIDDDVKADIEKQVLSALQDTCKVKSIPDSLLETLTARYDESIGFYANYVKVSKDEYCQSLYGCSYEEYIQKSAKQQLIMEAIIKAQKITIREYDYKGDLDAFAGDNGYSNEESFVEKYGKDSIVKAMLIQKAQDYVIDKADIEYK